MLTIYFNISHYVLFFNIFHTIWSTNLHRCNCKSKGVMRSKPMSLIQILQAVSPLIAVCSCTVAYLQYKRNKDNDLRTEDENNVRQMVEFEITLKQIDNTTRETNSDIKAITQKMENMNERLIEHELRIKALEEKQQ